ncbi:hypothetical protein VW35_06755 [Devosia soli]|uniref:Uncharacterized protein n=1 Tax=Devosia soli TaxID=361041 RepID=A0A0F5LCZ8_9HYPH|nr:hypothetical protein [Devosia soli]KKB80130.1 hypothetical protein VW35_06755 [Devosia soli]
MSGRPILSDRRIVNYNRLQSDVTAMSYVIRFNKPGGALGLSTIRACNRMITLANRLYAREHGLPRFRLLVEDETFTMADLAILVTRLTAAGLTFEERYARYTADGLRSAQRVYAPALDADGFPSKHL